MTNYDIFNKNICKYIEKIIISNDFKDIKNNYNFKFKIKKALTSFISLYLADLEIENVLLYIVDLSKPEKRFNNTEKLVKLISRMDNTINIHELFNDNLSYKEKLIKLNEVLNKKGEEYKKNIINKALISYFYYCYNDFLELNDFNEFIETLNLPIEKLNKYSSYNFDIKTPLDDTKLFENKLFDEKIKSIIDKVDINTDKRYIDILNKANEILKVSTDESVKTAKEINKLALDNSKETLKTHLIDKLREINKTEYFKLENRVIGNTKVKANLDTIENAKLLRDCFLNINSYFNDEYREIIMELVKDIDESNLYINKVNPLTHLLNTKHLLSEAILQENKDKIIKYTNEYKEEELKLDRIIFRIKSINDNDLMFYSIEDDINMDVPHKYSYDPVSLSRLRGILNIIDFFRDNNIDIDVFLDDPFSFLIDYLKDTLMKDNAICMHYIEHKDDIIYLINELEKNEDDIYKEFYIDKVIKVDVLMNTIYHILFLSPDVDNYKHVLDFMLLDEILVINYKKALENCPYNDYKLNRVEYIKNLIIVNDNDFNPYYINPRKKQYIDVNILDFCTSFNRIEYLQNNINIIDLINKILSLKKKNKKSKENDAYEIINESLDSLINEIKTYYKKYYTLDRIVNCLLNNKKITPTDLFILKKEINIDLLLKKKDIENYKDLLIDNLIELMNEYKNTNSINKTFSESTNYLKKSIKRIKKELLNSGIKKRYLKKYIKKNYFED